MEWILFPCFDIMWSKDLRPVKYWTQMHMYVYVMRCECTSLWCLMQGSNCWVFLIIKEWLNRVICRIPDHYVSLHIVRCHTSGGNFNFLLAFLAPLLREALDDFLGASCYLLNLSNANIFRVFYYHFRKSIIFSTMHRVCEKI